MDTDPKHRDNSGRLYVVATPIGNRDDITLRALNILEKVDLVASEDTRHTGRLLRYHKIKANLISYHEHNERERTPELIHRLKRGESVAIVSNAGTPSVSDPGYRLINEAIARSIKVIPIPGVSAAITALSVAGLPTDSFVFVGFPDRKKGKRLKQLEELANEARTIVFYESPKRILSLMEDLMMTMGDRYGVLSREMTKIHEEFIRGFLSEIIQTLKTRPVIKGECTLLVSGYKKDEDVSMETIRSEIKKGLEIKRSSLSDLAKEIAKKYSIPKNMVYEEALKIKESKN